MKKYKHDSYQEYYEANVMRNEEIMFNDINIAISKLSPKYKKVFQLFYIQNYSHNEIADELGINVSTSKTNLLKAKLKLSKLLQHYNNSFN